MNNFSEYVAVNKLEFDDLLNEVDQLKNQKSSPQPTKETVKPIVEANNMNASFIEVIDSLPMKNRELATDMIKLLLKGELFGYDANKGHILKYIPEKKLRIRIKCSNLRDILTAATKQLGPNQQGITEENMPEGLKDFLEMLSATAFGTTQLNDPNIKRLFLKYRQERLT